MKAKTKKAAAKRFKLTRRSKILRRHQMASHLKSKKSKSRIRRHAQVAKVSAQDRKRIARLLPYG